VSSNETPRPTGRRRLARWTVNVLLAAVTLVSLAWLVPSLLGLERYVITGGSMSGTFERGALAFEKEVPVSRLRVGDVITYLPPPQAGNSDLVTHRIVRISRDEEGRRVYRTRGDANAAVDPWTFRLREQTQPVVQFTVPYAGHALIALADRETRMLLVGGPAALVALLALGELLMVLSRRERPASTGAVARTATAGHPMPGQRTVTMPATHVPGVWEPVGEGRP
jgi:signal peptidase I